MRIVWVILLYLFIPKVEMAKNTSESTIKELVRQNYLYASVLHYYGIQFYQYSDHSLRDACQLKGLNESTVIRKLEQAAARGKISGAIEKMPIDIVLAYLIHTHHYFVKERLPFLVDMIHDIEVKKFVNQDQANDLKFIFPLFVEDFIVHVYEEEETLFQYIETLLIARKNPNQISKAYFAMNKHSIADFSAEHQDEDEMKGIRELTNSFETNRGASFYERQLITELRMLDNDFKLHAAVEDDILFPKALNLETKVKKMLKFRSKLN